MKVIELFEAAKGPLVWSLIGKVLKSGGRVKALLSTWNDQFSKNNPPEYYIITGITNERDKFGNDQFRIYYASGSSTFKHWFEVMDGDDGQTELKKQPDGTYHFQNKSGEAMVV